ncbi:hypothetical protein GCM10018793_58790 [Streptomyces sulfonofaciens]|uniref:Uncharacterized protein n=1 Tax=Streptomyces sulfonofaciens TaxID=68272 RepID=A0A919L6C7_9ACTN|nr:hypothetical protein GCM10018793_58790 [Streptomyces sulfonofaciens]
MPWLCPPRTTPTPDNSPVEHASTPPRALACEGNRKTTAPTEATATNDGNQSNDCGTAGRRPRAAVPRDPGLPRALEPGNPLHPGNPENSGTTEPGESGEQGYDGSWWAPGPYRRIRPACRHPAGPADTVRPTGTRPTGGPSGPGDRRTAGHQSRSRPAREPTDQ